MSVKRLFQLFAIIVLVIIAAFTVRQVTAKTSAVADRSYDSIEQIRAGFVTADPLYNPVMSGSAAHSMSLKPNDGCLDAECYYQLSNGLWV